MCLEPIVFYLRSHLVSGLNEAQVLDISSQKEFIERQSDRYEVGLFRKKHSTDKVWTISEGKRNMRVWGCGNAKKCSDYRTIAIISHASKVMLKILQALIPL